jgi:pimeloyl-ACP methyl ester carboxylesterase
MFISRHGKGPRTFLGLHGWSGDHRTFAPLLTALPEDATFYALDLPGCGQSPDPARWTLNEISSSIAEVARSIPAPFTLVGNCSGALLGMVAAQQLHGRVERMLLIDVFAEFPWYFRIFLLPLLGPVAYYTTFANPMGRWITNASLSARRTEDTTLTGGFAKTRHWSTYRYLQLFKSYPAPDTFDDLTMPIDLVCGSKTFGAAIDSLAIWKAVWPQACMWRLEGAGHLPILEATSRVRDILFKEGSLSTECPIPSQTIAG